MRGSLVAVSREHGAQLAFELPFERATAVQTAILREVWSCIAIILYGEDSTEIDSNKPLGIAIIEAPQV